MNKYYCITTFSYEMITSEVINVFAVLKLNIYVFIEIVYRLAKKVVNFLCR